MGHIHEWMLLAQTDPAPYTKPTVTELFTKEQALHAAGRYLNDLATSIVDFSKRYVRDSQMSDAAHVRAQYYADAAQQLLKKASDLKEP